jgi:hypothetical protein
MPFFSNGYGQANHGTTLEIITYIFSTVSNSPDVLKALPKVESLGESFRGRALGLVIDAT